MEELLEVSYWSNGAIKSSAEYQLVRYADDFVPRAQGGYIMP